MDLARLDKLHDMMKKGVITKKEFDAEKAKLILDDAGDTTPLDRLEKLNDLLKSGAISRAEFNQQKKRLMENYGDDAPVITKRRASVVRPDNLFDVHGRDAGKLYRDTRTLGESVSAVGALLNVIPFFFYDFTEKKQKSVVRVLKVRALFEDYANNALSDKELVEAIDIVNNAREMATATPKEVSKSMYKNISDKKERKAAKKAYREALEFNEEIDISKFVCDELDKFNSENVMRQVELYKNVYDQGLDGIKNINVSEVKAELKKAKTLPKNTKQEKEMRKIEIELAKKKLSSHKNYIKHFGSVTEFKEPDMSVLEGFFQIEDECDDKITELSAELREAKKANDPDEVAKLKQQIKDYSKKRKDARKASKKEMDNLAVFNRAADAYITSRKLLLQQENFSHFDEIAAKYDEAKIRAQEEERIKAEENERKRKELEEELAKRKAAKAAKKNGKK